jgi:hypothetical protein
MSQILRAKERFDLGSMQSAIEVWPIGNIDREVDIDPTLLSNASFLHSRSTKSESCCRNGAFQSRQLIRSGGDSIRMRSKKGMAATMRVIIR